MTRGRLIFLVFLAVVVLLAVFVWPTGEKLAEVRLGPPQDSTEAVKRDPNMGSPTGHAVSRALKAAEDIEKMNDAARKAAEH